jgi:hypothetical protein
MAKGYGVNTRRTNVTEELGRVDAEKAWTRTGYGRLEAEKSRLVRELNKGQKFAGYVANRNDHDQKA